jgi:hypothetical protein
VGRSVEWDTGAGKNAVDPVDFPSLCSGMVWLVLRTERLHEFTQISDHCFRNFLFVLGCCFSGPATKLMLRCAFTVLGDARFARLAQFSVSHLYNLRASAPYRQRRLVWRGIWPSPVAISS